MNINRFLTQDQKVRIWPKKHTDKDLVLAYLITKFKFTVTYNETQVNDILKQWHTFNDWPLLRRELFEHGYFNRTADGAVYTRLR